MGRKPSVSKQIEEVLGTRDKAVQLERVTNLLEFVTHPVVAVTVLYHQSGEVFVSLASPFQVTSAQLKVILQQAVNQITELEIQQKLQQEEVDDLEADEPLNDSEVPDNMLPE